MCNANAMGDFYNENGDWAGGDFSLEGLTIMSKETTDNIKVEMDNRLGNHITDMRTEMKLQSQYYEGKALMYFGIAGYITSGTFAYVGKGGNELFLGMELSGIAFATGLDLMTSSKNGTLKESQFIEKPNNTLWILCYMLQIFYMITLTMMQINKRRLYHE